MGFGVTLWSGVALLLVWGCIHAVIVPRIGDFRPWIERQVVQKMGVGKTFGEAFVKSQLGAGTKLPRPTDKVKTVFLTVKNNDKPRAVEVARQLVAMGFDLVATKGTAAAITAAGIAVTPVNKVTEGRPHVVDMIKNEEIALVINTVEERRNAIADSRQIRTSSLLARVTTFTTIAGAEAAVEGMKYMDQLDVYSVQELHAQLTA